MLIRASRPHMPGYGILGAGEGRGLLPWSWAEERLQQAHNYWLATVTPEIRPHLMAVWGVWWESAFYFSTSSESRKARNLGANPQCVVSTESAAEAVIVEGRVEAIAIPSTNTEVSRTYASKYGEEPLNGSPFYRVVPEVAFGFVEAEADFQGAATRWRFG